MNQGTNLGSQKGRWIILAALVAVLGALLFLLPGVMAQQTAETYYHQENSDDPVVTLSATDPEGVAPIHWVIFFDDGNDQDLPGGNVGVDADDIEATDTTHGGLFEVENGVLSFKSTPNYEAAGNVEGLTGVTYPADRTYKVVVQASDGGVTEWVQYFKITVIVTDVEETGKVAWTVDPDGTDNAAEAAGQDLLEFQAGAQLSATVTDPDGPDEIAVATTTWRWYRSSSMSATGGTVITDEDGAPIATATYDVSDASDNNDVGMYLRAEATYTDRRGANKTAKFVSPHRVRPAKVGSNTLPKFAPTNFDRQVQEGPEGMTVGGVVTATDADGDVLNYTLAGTDAARFDIDQATGQITTAVALDYEAAANADNNCATRNSCVVTVKATDSAGGETGGADDLADATVTITLLDVNEAPEFVATAGTGDPAFPATATNTQGMAADKTEEGIARAWVDDTYVVSTYGVNDPEGVAINGNKWSLSGADAAKFELTGTTDNYRTLRFQEKPDFEMPGDSDKDNIYEVTVEASDVEKVAMRSVTVKITDSDEAGKITLSTENPVTGTPVKATLTDSDGDVINVAWKWYALTDAQVATETDIATAIAATGADSTEVKADEGKADYYTPTSGDITKHLLAVATYMDRTEDEDNDTTNNDPAPGYMNVRFNNMAMSGPTAPVIDDPANAAPMFVEGATATRYVEEDDEENRPNRSPVETIGAPVSAMDADSDSLTYTLSGADAASFAINAGTGQLMTKAALDYDGTKKRYTVVVTAKDGSGASNDTDRITVTIEVKGKDEKPAITGNSNFDNHDENTNLVGTLSATDPERVTPIYWEILDAIPATPPTVDGTALVDDDIADRANFNISQAGVLTFKEGMLPDFESRDPITDQEYKVVVQASDGGVTEWVQYFRVTVTVTDVEETGKVAWTVDPDGTDNAAEAAGQDLLEFQAGAQLSATVTDPDGPDEIAVATTTWRWYRSSSMSATGGTVITDENGTPIATATYDVSDTADNNDVGMYLRAEATYTDRRGANKTAKFVSPHRVRPAKVDDNAVPKFAPTAHTRRVQEGPEGMTVGGVVTATDADGDVLNYTLAGTDAARFDIDQATGQITTAVALDYEAAANADNNCATRNSCVVTVKATDSAGGETGGADDLADATVTITLLDVNEAPEFVATAGTGDPAFPATATNTQGMAADKTEEGIARAWVDDTYVVSTYGVNDPEGVAINGNKWSLSGADAAKFELTGTTDNYRTLRFQEKPDFEMPGDSDKDNIYEVTVEASDVEKVAMRSVTVKITDSDEAGKITLSTENPVTGTPVKATLTDSDGDVINVAWKWYALTDAQVATETDIATAIAATGADSTEVKADEGKADYYTPTSGDITKHLLAVATYMDRTEDEDNDTTNNDPAPGYMNVRFDNMAMSGPTAPVTDDPANAAPMFVEGATATRYVEEDDEENRPNRSPVETIGAPVSAMDADSDSLTYTLSGADAASFAINAGTGQLMTKAALDYEAKDTYVVIVTVDDGSKASNDTDSITVTIEVKDLDEKPEILEGGLAISGETSINYAEKGTDAVVTYTAIGSGADSVRWILEGADADDFADPGSGATAMISFNNSPDYEDPADADGDNIYELTLEASDGTYSVSRVLTVSVTNVDELGTLTGEPSVVYAESRTDAVGTYEVTGGDGSAIAWSLEGADAGQFTPEGMGMSIALVFSSAPDFEAPGDADGDNTYMVTVKAEAGGEEKMVEVTITVTNDDEDGTVTLSTDTPVVGNAVTAEVTDPDGNMGDMPPIAMDTVIIGATWQWARADSMEGTFVPISSETSASYTPTEADVYLRATATYTDGQGNSKSAMDVSDNAVVELAITDGDDMVEIEENNTSVETYTASVSGATWSLSGDDMDDLSIDSNSGVLTFNTAPDYENPADTGADNVYNVTVMAAYGTATPAELDVTVTVTDVEEGPVQRYDDNDDGISATELSAAISDYLSGELSPAELSEVIAAYLNR